MLGLGFWLGLGLGLGLRLGLGFRLGFFRRGVFKFFIWV